MDPIGATAKFQAEVDLKAADLTVVMDSKAWLAMLFISFVAVALSFSTVFVWSLYRVAVKPVAMMTPAKMGPSLQESANKTITAPPACNKIFGQGQFGQRRVTHAP